MREDPKSFIETENYIRLFEGVQRLKRLPKGAPRMGIAYGDYGLGKSLALDRINAKEGNTIVMRCRKTWSKKTFLMDLAHHIGDISGKTAHELYLGVLESLSNKPKILIIDEVDHLLDDKRIPILELVRDIYDETPIIIVFIGMVEAKAKFARYKHYNSRISDFIRFQPVSEGDVRKFCALSDIKIKDDLIGFFANKFPNLRHIKVFMERIEEWCEINDSENMDLKTFHSEGLEHGLGE